MIQKTTYVLNEMIHQNTSKNSFTLFDNSYHVSNFTNIIYV